MPLLLVVEDHEDTRVLYAECLSKAGFRVQVATNGNEALVVALAEPPDAIVLDLAMPRLDGWETARLLRAYGRTRTIPIVACTARTDSYDVARAKDAGCDRVVFKPCSPEELEKVVRQAIPAIGERERGI
jgi:two-component system, OmpR family, phosphate regulon response regulator PhoB